MKKQYVIKKGDFYVVPTYSPTKTDYYETTDPKDAIFIHRKAIELVFSDLNIPDAEIVELEEVIK